MLFQQIVSFFLLTSTSLAQPIIKTRAQLVRRSCDDGKQLLTGKVSIDQFSISFTEATQEVEVSSRDGNSVTLKQHVSKVQVYATELTTFVRTFDGQQAEFHQTTMIQAFASYVSMINTISKFKDGRTSCHNELVQINAAFRSITSTYLRFGIDLRKAFAERQEEPAYDPTYFVSLDLPPPFEDEENHGL